MDYHASGLKTAIPRLRRRDDDDDDNEKSPQATYVKPRVPKACDNCRKRKVRCSGERPKCQNCVNQHLHCNYSQARKDRLKEFVPQILVFAPLIRRLSALLKDLSVQVDDEAQQKIDELLDSLGDNASATRAAMGSLRKQSMGYITSDAQSRDDPGAGEADVTGSVSSGNGLDLVDEDLLRSRESRATGFVGQNSEVQWFRSLKNKMEVPVSTGLPRQMPYGPPGSSNEAAAHRVDAWHARQKSSPSGNILHVSDSTFYLDAENLDMNIIVDPYELPLPETAERLFDCYMQTVHTSFPILPNTFEEQFRKYIDSVKCCRPHQVSKSWQAFLNLVLAIGAQYSHLAQAEWRADGSDYLVYMTRATKISGIDIMATSPFAPTLSSIQVTGLLSLYYLTIGQVSRAWMMIGTSLRFALAVGLHLQNNDPSASPSKKQSLVQTWWSLHAIESLLCTLVGRPCVIPNDQCTVPLPLLAPKEQSEDSSSVQLRVQLRRTNRGTTPSGRSSLDSSSRSKSTPVTRTPFLRARVTIGLIIQKALSKLYSPRTSADSWEQIRKEIGLLSRELDEWGAEVLPEGIGPETLIQEFGVPRERLLLSFQYHSAKLLTYRPCLCRLEQRIQGQSDVSASFNQKTAEACVRAAHAVTSLFPDEPDLAFIYQQSPWWCIVHTIMQAIAVFLLEMCIRGTHTILPNEAIVRSIKKLVRWLRLMSVSSVVARRAYNVIADIVKSGAPRLRVEVSDVLVEEKIDIDQNQSFQPYQPPGNSAFPSYHTSFFPPAELEILSSYNLTATANTSNQDLSTLWVQQPAQDLGGVQPDQYFMRESSPRMLSAFGNPFSYNFDLSNPLDGSFFTDIDVAMNDA